LPLFPHYHNHYLSQKEFRALPPLPKEVVVLDASRNNICDLPSELISHSMTDLKFSHNRHLSERFPAQNCRNLVISNIEETGIEYDQSRVHVISAGKGVGFCEMNTFRDSMEDSLIVHQNIQQDVSIYAAFHGHGGWKTASEAAFHFAGFPADQGSPTTEFLTRAFQGVNEAVQDPEFTSGSTAAIVVRQGNRLGIAHVGDSKHSITRTWLWGNMNEFVTQEGRWQMVARMEIGSCRDQSVIFQFWGSVPNLMLFKVKSNLIIVGLFLVVIGFGIWYFLDVRKISHTLQLQQWNSLISFGMQHALVKVLIIFRRSWWTWQWNPNKPTNNTH
jgi:hypothetical protein